MRSSVPVILVIALAAALTRCAAHDSSIHAPLDQQALSLIERTQAADVDSSLPAEPINAWLKRTARVTDVVWEIDTTCGTGVTAGLAERFACLQSTLNLPSGEQATILLAFERMDDRLAEKPRLRILIVDLPDGSRYRDSDRLSDLATLIGN